MGRIPVLVVMVGDSCYKGRGFESRFLILDGHIIFSNIFVVRIVMFFEKTKIYEKKAEDGPFFQRDDAKNQLPIAAFFTFFKKWVNPGLFLFILYLINLCLHCLFNHVLFCLFLIFVILPIKWPLGSRIILNKDMNPGPNDERRVLIHWAMGASYIHQSQWDLNMVTC